jgi:hypothetical protein
MIGFDKLVSNLVAVRLDETDNHAQQLGSGECRLRADGNQEARSTGSL